MDVVIQFDGLCEDKNPGGTGACGWVIYRGKIKSTGRRCLGQHPEMTNNIAEYSAIGFALADLNASVDKIDTLTVLGDSKLVVCQIAGSWRCKSKRLQRYRDRCLELLDGFDCDWVIRWIPRELNEEADALSREAYNLDRFHTNHTRKDS